MRGQIIAMNAQRGMFAVALEDGDFLVFEEMGSDFSIGDELSRLKHEHGDQRIYNETNCMWEEIYVQVLGANKKRALQALMLT